MEHLTAKTVAAAIKRSRHHDPCRPEGNCLGDVTNTLSRRNENSEDVMMKRLLSDYAGLDCGSEENGQESFTDDVALKLMSVLDGHFESPGFSDGKYFRSAVHRQKIVSQCRIGEHVVYDSAWDSVSPGRMRRVYVRNVPDWDGLSGATFHVRWWSKGLRQFCKWDRDLSFWTYEELQEAHREHLSGTSGPQHSDWCHVNGTMDWSMFWSAALLFKYCGSSGVKYWDEQFQAMEQRYCK